jgi:hypothetical protein
MEATDDPADYRPGPCAFWGLAPEAQRKVPVPNLYPDAK